MKSSIDGGIFRISFTGSSSQQRGCGIHLLLTSIGKLNLLKIFDRNIDCQFSTTAEHERFPSNLNSNSEFFPEYLRSSGYLDHKVSSSSLLHTFHPGPFY